MRQSSAPVRRPVARTARTATALLLALATGTVLAVVAVPGAAQAAGSSLAGETFTNATVSDSRWLALGAACLTAATTAGSGTALGACTHTTDAPAGGASPGYLQLTDDSGGQSSSVLYNRALPSSAGIDVKFDTYQYGTHSTGADGIGFFLTDGSYTLSAAGPNGGSLGYTSRTDQVGNGIANGYLGVGLDVFGNNSNLPTYQGSGCSAYTSHTATPQSVVVRGPGNGTTGYCVLNTTRVATVQAGATLDAASTTTPAATLLTQSKRNVEITVSPTSQASPNPTVTTSVDFSGTGTNYVPVSSVVVPTAAPATVKLGFSASTGGSQETHLIRGVTVATIDPVGAVSLAAQVDHSVGTGTPRTAFTAGDTVPLSFIVTATSANPLSNIVVSDPDVTNIVCPATTLAVANSMTCTGSRVLAADDVQGSGYSTTATVTASDGSSPTPATATSTAVVPTYRTGLSIAQAPSPTTVTAAGQSVTFTSTVTNTGTVALTQVAAASTAFTGSGTLTGPTCAASSLAAQASTQCTATYTTTQADVEAGQVAESVRASGSYGSTAVTSSTVTSSVAATSLPALTIAPAVAPTSITAVGQPIAYSFLVTNTGNRALSSVAVPVDAFTGGGGAGAVSCPATSLSVGAHETCTLAYTATQDDVDAGSVALTARATGTTAAGAVVASTPATLTLGAVRGPALALTAAATPSTVTAAGQQVTLAYTLANTGNVTLGALGIASSSFTGSGTLGAPTCATAILPVGGATTCTVRYTATQADVDAGGVVAVARATASAHGLPVTSGPRTLTVTAAQTPALTVAPSVAPSGFAAAGTALAYSFLVTNTGDTTVSGVTVPVDAFGGSAALGAVTCPPGALAPGATTTCTAAYTTTQDDLDAGAIALRVRAHGTIAGGAGVDSAVAALATTGLHAPALTVTSAAAAPSAVSAAGAPVRFQWVLANTGNSTLRSVGVAPGAFTGSGALGDVDCPDGTLAPGARETCTASYAVTADDMVSGGFGATITGTALDGRTAVASQPATAAVAVHLAPAVALAQSADPATMTRVGQVVRFTELVTNTGNAALTGVHVSLTSFTGSGSADPVCPSTALAVGATEPCTFDHAVTQADLGTGTVTSTAVASGSVRGSAVSSAPATTIVTAAAAPALTLTVTGGGSGAPAVGETVTYTFLVRNAGTVPAVDPVVTAPAIDGAGRLSAIHCPPTASLAPGATMTCTATYVVQQADAGHSLVVTARAAATAPNGTRTVTRPATAASRVPAPAPADVLAFTGAGPIGAVIAGSGLLAALLAGVLIVLGVRRRRLR